MAKRIDIILSLRTAGFTDGISKANTSLSSLGKTIGRVQRTFTAFAALFAIRGLGRQFVGIAKQAGDFQLQMIQIGRTSGIAGAELESLRLELMKLSTTMVASVDELANLSIMAGRAGIKTKQGMLDIAKAASMMGNVTDLSAVEATNALLKLSKAMRLPTSSAEQIGSVIVTVGKNVAATESEIVKAMLRMTASGKMMGATIPQLASLAGITIELGLAARRAGMAWNRSFFQMGKNLEKAADIMKMTAPEFKDAVNKDFIGTIELLLKKIAAIPDNVERLEKVREVFQMVGARGVGPLIGNLDKFDELLKMANTSWAEGTELAKDYQKVLMSFNKQTKLVGDTFTMLKMVMGSEMLPVFTKFMQIIKFE